MWDSGFVAWVTVIFVIVALQLLFPSNVLLPLDRRASTMLGAVWCMILFYLYPSKRDINIGIFVDFDVLIVLTAIMVINFILLRQPFLAHLEHQMQSLIRKDKNKGFFLVSLVSLLVSPVIMNDGLCLMLVHPVLDAFPPLPQKQTPLLTSDDHDKRGQENAKELNEVKSADDRDDDGDALYYMLNIACSANIGSALTFSGNPQNLLVAQHLSKLLSGGVFFALMIVPVAVSWVMTLSYLQLCRMARHRNLSVFALLLGSSSTTFSSPKNKKHSRLVDQEYGAAEEEEEEEEYTRGGDGFDLPPVARSSEVDRANHIPQQQDPQREGTKAVVSAVSGTFTITALLMIIALEFQGALSLTGVFAGISLSLLAALYLARYYPVFGETLALAWREGQLLSLLRPAPPSPSPSVALSSAEEARMQEGSDEDDRRTYTTTQQRLPSTSTSSSKLQRMLRRLQRERDAIAASLEALVRELDVNLLLIFTGLFIVSGAFVTTQVPKQLWTSLASSGGDSSGGGAFQSWTSIAVLSTYIVTASQLVGNVPVVYMARDQVALLDRRTQILGWLLLAFVSTVAGNFTLVGSAANIIVAEKSRRHGARPVSMDAAYHFRHCGAVTALSIVLGAVIIVLEVQFFL